MSDEDKFSLMRAAQLHKRELALRLRKQQEEKSKVARVIRNETEQQDYADPTKKYRSKGN